MIAPDFEPQEPIVTPAHGSSERKSLLGLSKARWSGYGTLLLDLESSPAAGGRIDSQYRSQDDKYLRRRAFSVLGAASLFVFLTLFLLRELFWSSTPPVEQVLIPGLYALPRSYNATVIGRIPFSVPVPVSHHGRKPREDGEEENDDDDAPKKAPKSDWWMQATYDFEPPTSSWVLDDEQNPDTLLLFHSVGVRHRGHVHLHTSPDPVGPHIQPPDGPPPGSPFVMPRTSRHSPRFIHSTEGSVREPACDVRPRATAQLYAYGPHRELLASSLALAEVLISDGRRGLTLASDFTPWLDARNAITVHVELTLHPSEACPPPPSTPPSQPQLDPPSSHLSALSLSPQNSDSRDPLGERIADRHTYRPRMAIDIASSRLGIAFHGTPQPVTSPVTPAPPEPEPEPVVPLRSLRLSSYFEAINLYDLIQVEDQVWVQTWFGTLTSTGTMDVSRGEVLLHAPVEAMVMGPIKAISVRVTGGQADCHMAHLHAKFTQVSSTSGRISASLDPTGPVLVSTSSGEIDAYVDLGSIGGPPTFPAPHPFPILPSRQPRGRETHPNDRLTPIATPEARLVSEIKLVSSNGGRIMARYRAQQPDVPLHSYISTTGAVSVTHPKLFQGMFNLSGDLPAAISAPASKQWRIDDPLNPNGYQGPYQAPYRGSNDVGSVHHGRRETMVGRAWLAGRSPYGLDELGWGKSVVRAGSGPVVVAL